MDGAPANPPTPEGIRVLLIDDDEKLSRLTARYLETHGLLVERAFDGQSGVRAVARDCSTWCCWT